MKEKILAYVKDNRLFVSVIAVLMVIFCFFLWMTCGAGNSMEAETSYTDVTALSTSSSKQSSQSLSEASSQSKTEGSEKVKSKVTVDVKGAVVNPGVYTLKAGARVTDVIAYRESHGGFQSVDDLKNVSGIGDKTLDKIRESLYVA